MRTITENRHGSKDISIMDRITGYIPNNAYIENKSCFYELGAKKAAVFGAYSDKPVPMLVQKIREREGRKDLSTARK